MTEARNPYAPPMAKVADPQIELQGAEPLIENGRRVPIGNGMRWIGDTFELFAQRPWKWIGTMLLLFALSIAASLIPLSNLLTSLLAPVFAGGLAVALDSQRRTRNFTLSNIFAGFGPRFAPLAAVGCVALLASGLMFVVFFVMTSREAAMFISFGSGQLDTLPSNFWVALLVSLVATVPITAATFLAAPLILLHGVNPSRAITLSFFACMKNILPWILCGVLMFLFIAISIIPLFLGLFVTLPVAVMLFYSMYRDIFIGEQPQ